MDAGPVLDGVKAYIKSFISNTQSNKEKDFVLCHLVRIKLILIIDLLKFSINFRCCRAVLIQVIFSTFPIPEGSCRRAFSETFQLATHEFFNYFFTHSFSSSLHVQFSSLKKRVLIRSTVSTSRGLPNRFLTPSVTILDNKIA